MWYHGKPLLKLEGAHMKYLEIPIEVNGSVEDARLETYILDTPVEKIQIKKRPMIVICPGGGYEKLSYREGEPIAMQFLAKGYHACVLRYPVAPGRYPVPLLELGQVMRIIHSHAEEWRVNTDQIIVSGSSAGGHLAGMLGVFWSRQWLADMLETESKVLRPAGMRLCYPVITSDEAQGHLPSFGNLLGEQFEEDKDKLSLEKQVTDDTPPAFLWHTATDGTVPVANSMRMAEALIECGVPGELHIYPEGVHGLSLASEQVRRADGSGVEEVCQSWIDLADICIKHLCDMK